MLKSLSRPILVASAMENEPEGSSAQEQSDIKATEEGDLV